MTLAHVHILLNHFPTIGMIVGMGLYRLLAAAPPSPAAYAEASLDG